MPQIRMKMDVEQDPFEAIGKLHREGRLERDLIVAGEGEWEMGCLPKGMTSGKTSVSIAITLPDGRVVLAQTSLLALTSAVKGFNARYPEG